MQQATEIENRQYFEALLYEEYIWLQKGILKLYLYYKIATAEMMLVIYLRQRGLCCSAENKSIFHSL